MVEENGYVEKWRKKLLEDYPDLAVSAYPKELTEGAIVPRCWSLHSSSGDHDHLCERPLLHLDHHTCSYCGVSW